MHKTGMIEILIIKKKSGFELNLLVIQLLSKQSQSRAGCD